jgi:hypothetical protein
VGQIKEIKIVENQFCSTMQSIQNDFTNTVDIFHAFPRIIKTTRNSKHTGVFDLMHIYFITLFNILVLCILFVFLHDK